MNTKFEILTLPSGTKTLRSLESGETFHPGMGPLEEARILHVEQQQLATRSKEFEKFVLWDVGFGAAANSIAALSVLKNSASEVEIHSFDKSTDPIRFALQHADDLDYLLPHKAILNRLLHDREVQVSSRLRWYLHLGDFRAELAQPRLPSPHSVFYDPYSPAENQEMWTLEHFERLARRLDPGVPFLLSNYTRSTAVRTTLLLAGFYVGLGCEIGEKPQTTLASNRLELLNCPLNAEWLRRVRSSGNAAPMRGPVYRQSPIELDDFERLNRHPQFS